MENEEKDGIITKPPPRDGVVSSFEKWLNSLEQPTRGAQIFIYSVAGIGLAFAIFKVRPISKFSRPIDIPKHFIREKVSLQGKVVGCEPAPGGAKLLINHKPLIPIPFWHSSKPPLPIKIWGVNIAGGNSISWLQFVCIGNEVTFLPLKTQTDCLVANVTLHYPILAPPKASDLKKKKKLPKFEDISLGQRLLELGLATVNEEIPKTQTQMNWWMPWILDPTPPAQLFRAQNKAINYRAGIWQEKIPPSKFQILQKYIKKVLPPSKNVPSVL